MRLAISALLLALLICGACQQSKSRPVSPKLAVEFPAPIGQLAILLARYSARLNELIELKELRTLGYQPITLNVVRFSHSAHPSLICEAPSLQITLADPDTQSYMLPSGTDRCTVTLHNLSSLGVVAYVPGDAGDPRTGVSQSNESFSSHGKPVIDPEKNSRPQQITFGRAGKMTPQGRVKFLVPPQQIIVEAALFTDGSFEGKPEVAARLKAKQTENLASRELHASRRRYFVSQASRMERRSVPSRRIFPMSRPRIWQPISPAVSMTRKMKSGVTFTVTCITAANIRRRIIYPSRSGGATNAAISSPCLIHHAEFAALRPKTQISRITGMISGRRCASLLINRFRSARIFSFTTPQSDFSSSLEPSSVRSTASRARAMNSGS
jgi:hypothetical protein